MYVGDNKQISDMRVLLAARRNQRVAQNRQPSVIYVFEHKTKHILIHASQTRNVAFWHINNLPPRVSLNQICYNPPIFCIAAIFVKYSCTTGSWSDYKLIYIVRVLIARDINNCETGLFNVFDIFQCLQNVLRCLIFRIARQRFASKR